MANTTQVASAATRGNIVAGIQGIAQALSQAIENAPAEIKREIETAGIDMSLHVNTGKASVDTFIAKDYRTAAVSLHSIAGEIISLGKAHSLADEIDDAYRDAGNPRGEGHHCEAHTYASLLQREIFPRMDALCAAASLCEATDALGVFVLTLCAHWCIDDTVNESGDDFNRPKFDLGMRLLHGAMRGAVRIGQFDHKAVVGITFLNLQRSTPELVGRARMHAIEAGFIKA